MRTEKVRSALSQLSRAVQSAVERFVSVGERCALEHADLRAEMLDACRVARLAGTLTLTLAYSISLAGGASVLLEGASLICIYFTHKEEQLKYNKY